MDRPGRSASSGSPPARGRFSRRVYLCLQGKTRCCPEPTFLDASRSFLSAFLNPGHDLVSRAQTQRTETPEVKSAGNAQEQGRRNKSRYRCNTRIKNKIRIRIRIKDKSRKGKGLPLPTETPREHPGGNGEPFFGYAGSSELDLPWVAFLCLTHDLEGYGDVSVPDQPRKVW